MISHKIKSKQRIYKYEALKTLDFLSVFNVYIGNKITILIGVMNQLGSFW